MISNTLSCVQGTRTAARRARVMLGRHDGRPTRGATAPRCTPLPALRGIAREEAKQAMRTATIEPGRETVERVVCASLIASLTESESCTPL